MRRIEYQNLSTELKALVKKMEKDLNKEKPFVSRLQVLTKNPLQNSSPNTDDEKLEYDVAVFQVDKSKGEYIFSHIENKDREE